MAKKKTVKKEDVKEPAKEPKAITTKSVKVEVNGQGLQEITLLKDHGFDKKGDKLLKHPNTAKMLIDAGKAK